MRKVLIETRMNALKLSESKSTPKKGCLGRIEGICADFKNPTRNGRLYPLSLWKKVFNDSLFKENLENKTLYGELDHPEERFEPLMAEACIVMTDYKIDEDAGVIYAGFDILDTPKGRILKSIVDYGSVVGVSSRGQGDIIESVNGEEVDTDSYEFACFDVVSTPAVERARQSVVESIKKTNFKESIQRQIEDASSVADLNIIRSVVRASDIQKSEIDSIVESIEDRCKMLQSAGKTISAVKNISESEDDTSAETIRESKVEIANGKLYRCINDLRKQVNAYKTRANSYAESVQLKDNKINQLRKELAEQRKQIRDLKADNQSKLASVTESHDVQLSKEQSRAKRLSEKMNTAVSDNRKLQEKLQSQHKLYESKLHSLSDALNEKSAMIAELQEQLNESTAYIKELEKSSKSEIRQIDSEVDEYSQLLSEAQDKIASNTNTISELKETLNTYKTKLQSSKSDITKLSESLTRFQEMYAKNAADMLGIDANTIIQSITESTTPTQIDDMANKQRERIDRYNRLGISQTGLTESTDISVEHMSSDGQDDDRLLNLCRMAWESK